MTTDVKLRALLEDLLDNERIPERDWPMELGPAERLGFVRLNGEITLASGLDLLSRSEVLASLSARAGSWLHELEIHPVISSTNDRLVLLAESRSIDGVVCLAELQTRGRGRRGRPWLSPFAGHLALSLGITVSKAMHELGGLSLAVGLAVVDCLVTLGVGELRLKWPNDILLGGRKLGGILIELMGGPTAANSVEVVIGVGLNVNVPDDVRHMIDQALTDLVGEGYAVSRNILAARLVSSLFDYAKEFERIGFGPMRNAFNDLHALQGEICHLSGGDGMIVGRVSGVTESGELLLETDRGTMTFGAGEVALRRYG